MTEFSTTVPFPIREFLAIELEIIFPEFETLFPNQVLPSVPPVVYFPELMHVWVASTNDSGVPASTNIPSNGNPFKTPFSAIFSYTSRSMLCGPEGIKSKISGSRI